MNATQYSFANIDDILKNYGVKSYKETGGGLIAIHKKNPLDGCWYWLYYKFCDDQKHPGWAGYYFTGSTLKFER